MKTAAAIILLIALFGMFPKHADCRRNSEGGRTARIVIGILALIVALLAGPAPGEEVVFASEDGEGAPANGVARVRTNGDGAVQPVRVPAAAVSEFDRAGRNDPCPCGSGKKFKFCHGK